MTETREDVCAYVQVDAATTVDELTALVRAAVAPVDVGGATYAVFAPADGVGVGHWLAGDVAVGAYDDIIGEVRAMQ